MASGISTWAKSYNSQSECQYRSHVTNNRNPVRTEPVRITKLEL